MNWIILIFILVLLYCSYLDVRYRQIPVDIIAIMGLATLMYLFYKIYVGQSSLIECSIAMLPGILFLMTSFITKEKIGYGDGIFLLFTAVWLDYKLAIWTFFFSLLICSLLSFFMLLLKKVNKDTHIPFLPFLSLGAILSLIIGY